MFHHIFVFSYADVARYYFIFSLGQRRWIVDRTAIFSAIVHARCTTLPNQASAKTMTMPTTVLHMRVQIIGDATEM